MIHQWATWRVGWRTMPFVASWIFAAGQSIAQSPAKLPFRADDSPDLWRAGLQAILIAMLCLGIVAAALYAWRQRFRLQSGGTSQPGVAAQVEWARRVSARTTLLVVRWRGKEYLLAESATAVRVIDSHAAEEPPA